MIALALTTFAISNLVLDIESYNSSDCTGVIDIPRQTIRGGECFTPFNYTEPGDSAIWYMMEGSCSDKIEFYAYTDANCTTRETDDGTANGTVLPPGILDMNVSGPCKPTQGSEDHSNYIYSCADGSDGWWHSWGKYVALVLVVIGGVALLAAIV